MPITVTPYDPTWPALFTRIADQLATYLSSASVPYITIEHVGSTSIPNLAAKPNIDIIILVTDAAAAEAAREALMWEPEPTEYYISIGDGGIKGRISMKFQDWRLMPYRSVYIISEDNEEGMLSLKGYRDLKRILTAEGKQAEMLKEEYENVKWELVEEGVDSLLEYGRRKTAVIHKILKSAGWSDEELEKLAALDVREERVREDLF